MAVAYFGAALVLHCLHHLSCHLQEPHADHIQAILTMHMLLLIVSAGQ